MPAEHPWAGDPGGGTPRYDWPDTHSWPAQRRPMPVRRLVVGAAIFVLVAGAIGAALVALMAARGSGDVLARLLPDDTALYLGVYLDPPAGQRASFNNLLHQFPDVRDDQQRDRKVDGIIDDALRGSHLSHGDVRAWLGSQVALAAPVEVVDFVTRPRLRGPTSGAGGLMAVPATQPLQDDEAGTGGAPPFSILIASRDDGRARQTLDTFRSGPDGRRYDWSQDSHDGVARSRGSPRSGEGAELIYALVDHTVVFGSTTGVVDSIIDTAHGRRSSLAASQSYRRATGRLAGDHLAMGYANGQALVARLRERTNRQPAPLGEPMATPGARPDEALRGMALALTAEDRGLALEANLELDPSALSAEQRRMGEAAVSATTLGLIPGDAYGFVAVAGLDRIAHSLIGSLGSAVPGSRQILEQLRVTGPDGILQHLTGDGAAEVRPESASHQLGGAVVLATDDEAAMARFLGGLADIVAMGGSTRPVVAPPLAIPSAPGGGSGPRPQPAPTPLPGQYSTTALTAAPPQALLAASGPRPAGPAAAAATPGVSPRPFPIPLPRHQPVPAPQLVTPDRSVHHSQMSYRGVVITAATTSATEPGGLQPAWAVSHGFGIIGTSIDAVRAVLDAPSRGGIASVPRFRNADPGAQRGGPSLLYVDLAAVLSAVRDSQESADDSRESRIVAELEPLKYLLLSGRSYGDHNTIRFFLGIG